MEQQENEETKREEVDKEAVLPIKFRISFSVFFILIVIFSICVILLKISDKDGFMNLSIFSLVGLLLINIPLEKIGIAFSKIGPIEFRETFAKQKFENIELITQLEDQIIKLQEELDELKSKTQTEKNSSKTKIEKEKTQEQVLIDLIRKFLEKYPTWYFNPIRIKNKSRELEDLKELSNYSTKDIGRNLRKMVLNDIVKTKISKSGSTLYGINL